MPLTLPKVTKSSEHEKELTPHLGFSRENSNPTRLETQMAVNRTLVPAARGASLHRLVFIPGTVSSILDCKLFHTVPSGTLGNLSLSLWDLQCHAPRCSQPAPCFSSGLFLAMPVSHSLPALHKWLFPRNALLLSGGL